MKLTRLYLRNYRVYEDEVELELPGGLVGIYGVNGSGKSYLVESVLWTIWGRSRTDKSEVRTAGVNADCVTEVEFEHEGHLYLVRRTITGINHTVKAEALADGMQVAVGATDVRRYLHTVLGMDDTAFRASVFAEQKQIAAFTGKTAAQRRDLVLRLLGITPLDTARDLARADAKASRDGVERARAVLPDLEALRAAADAATLNAEAAALVATEAVTARDAAQVAAAGAEVVAHELDQQRVVHERLLDDGKAVRAELDALDARIAALDAELERLRADATELAGLESDPARLEAARRTHALVVAVERAHRERAALPAVPGDAVAPPDEAAVAVARDAADAARTALVEARSRHERAAGDLQRARAQLERAEKLGGNESCEVCGQPLGDAFEQVLDHRRREVDQAAALATEAAAAVEAAKLAATAALASLQAGETELRDARAAWEQAAGVRARHEAAAARVAEAEDALGRPAADGEGDALEAEVAALQVVADRAAHLAGVLTRLPEAESAREGELRRHEAAAARRAELLDEVKRVGFDAGALDKARTVLREANAAVDAATQAVHQTASAAEGARARAGAAAESVTAAEAQHAALNAHAEDARHLGRAADLLNAFRTNVVASVGPRLATEAASLFAELTDHEYDLLKVDPETYGIEIVDAGVDYALDRYSGSEVDLANLALRVAISEQVRFQSGGAVGLLVLDEVFGPLDGDRRDRMLLALERLRARFRQILVVTHADEIKAQLPVAIEVVKLAPRRATARVVNAS